MDQILEKLETLIDDVERDNTVTIENVLSILYELKTDIEDYNIQKEENPHSINWDDLDNY